MTFDPHEPRAPARHRATSTSTCARRAAGLAAALVALGAGPARAAEPVELGPVVVTGTRSEEAPDEAPVAVEVIDRAAIEASGARTAADVLDGTLGLAARPSFRGVGVEVQGLSTKHVLVLVDGQRVTGKVDEELDLSRFPAESIERIEIVKGAASALYGSDAIGGVIHIITKRPPRDGARGDVELAAGEGGRAVMSGRIGLGGRRLGASLTLGLHHDDPWRLDASTPQTTGSGRDDVGTTLALQWRPSARLRVDARVQHLYRHTRGLDATRLPDGLDGGPRYRRVARLDHLHTLQARVAPRWRLGGGHALELALSGSFATATLLQDQQGGVQYDRRQVSREGLGSLTAEWSWAASEAHAVTAGLEVHAEALTSERVSVAEPDRLRLAVYAQDVWRLVADPRLTLVPGLRLDVDSVFGAALAPRLALRLDPWEALTLRLGFGLGFRAPGFRELYLAFDNASVGYRVAGNPDLDPERSVSWQAGLDVRPATGVTLGLDAFRHDVSGLVTFALDASGADDGGLDVYTYVNVDAATSQGLELTAAWQPSSEVRLELGYALTDSRDDTTGRRLVGRATHQATASLRARVPGELELAASAQILGPRPYEAADGSRYDSAWAGLVDTTVTWRASQHLSLFVGCDNLLDAGHADTLPIRPRVAFGGVRGRL